MAVTAAPQADFWRGKSVLVTGHSGFKGSWLTLALHQLGAKVTGISLPPLTTPSLFTEAKIEQLCRNHFFDIRDGAGLAGLGEPDCGCRTDLLAIPDGCALMALGSKDIVWQ